MAPSVPAWLEELCQRLVDNDKNFRTVELTHPRIDDVFAKVFAKALDENTTVTTLVLSCFSIVDDGAYAIGSVLANNKKLQKLQFRELRNSREVITFFSLLKENSSIEELSLRHSQICPVGAVHVANYFQSRGPDHAALQEIRFVDCQFIGNSLEILCEGLRKCRSLQRLYFVNTEIGSHGSVYVANVLQDGGCLRELYLGENEIGDDGVAALSGGVLRSTSLRLLDLRANAITSTGALSLQGIVGRSQFLQTLLLGSNELGNLGVVALGRGLNQASCVLQKLDLSDNGIDHEGACSIASSLLVNKSLEELNLSFNAIGDAGAGAFASGLQRNLTLRCLTLRRNSITNAGALMLAERLPTMNGLKELTLNKNLIDMNGCSALLEALRLNVELEYLSIQENFSEPVARQIIHWIRLNKAGRRIFRHPNVPCPVWPLVYGKVSAESDLLFHFLKEKPEVVSI